MFDITSWVREKIFRRPKLAIMPGEELSEKQTTKMGYFLLICMFGAIVSTAQWSLSIIKDIPTYPSGVPVCVENMLSFFDENNTSYDRYYPDSYSYGYSYGNGYNNCTLISENPQFDLTKEYNALLDAYNEWVATSQSLSQLQSSLRDIEYKERNTQNNYNTSLTEDIARSENRVYDSSSVSANLQSLKNQRASIEVKTTELNAVIASLKTVNRAKVSELKIQRDVAYDAYKQAYLLYKFIIAILSLLFSGMVFAVLYKFYLRYKRINSPHTVIFSVATFAYGIILLQVLLMFLWDVIPHKLLNILLGWISIFTPLLFVVQFLWPVLIVAIFGFLVYRIQKRLYSPQNILKRFVTDKKCPNCGNAVDMMKPFCPLCAHEIHIHCPHCHELTMKGMTYCSNCGGSLPKDDVLQSSHAHTIADDLAKEIAGISVEGYTGVKFILLDETSFISKRETIVRLSLYMTNMIGKTIFAPQEFSPYLEKILAQVDKKWISQAELDRVLGKIQTWVEIGWSIEFLKK
jgi:rRNA maturation protein Nop10